MSIQESSSKSPEMSAMKPKSILKLLSNKSDVQKKLSEIKQPAISLSIMGEDEIKSVLERKFDFSTLSKIISEVKNSLWKFDKRSKCF